jgi:hypothetical protein
MVATAIPRRHSSIQQMKSIASAQAFAMTVEDIMASRRQP